MTIHFGTVLSYVEEGLQSLQNADFPIYLTGSRYFHMEKPHSDWDFFCESNVHNLQYLESAGFVERDHDKYEGDILLVTVMEWRPSTFSAPIQVQLVKDVKAKLLIQELIRGSRLFQRVTDKYERKEIWTTLYRAYFHDKLPIVA
jgi:hypothetical protein